jgi:transposase
MRLREVIEERASRKFFEEPVQADRPIVLRSNDFFRQPLHSLIEVYCERRLNYCSPQITALIAKYTNCHECPNADCTH